LDDLELLRMELKGFRKEWTPFIKGIMTQETLPDWSRLWDEFIQEGIQDEDLNGVRHKNDDENIDFFIQVKKGKFNNISSGESTS